MVHKLNVNSHKDAIREDDVDGLLKKMQVEVQEFIDQRLADANDPNNLEELADISNFAFLLFAFLRAKGVKDMRERFIDEYFEIIPKTGRVFCAKTRSGSPLKVGDEIKGTTRNGRCYIRTQHAITGAVVSVARSDLIWYGEHGRWPVGQLTYRNRNKSDDRIHNLVEAEPAPRTEFPFVFTYAPKGREQTANYGRYGYQRRHAFELVRVGYWDTKEEAAREGLIAWKARIKEKSNV